MDETKKQLSIWWQQALDFYNGLPQEYQWAIIGGSALLFILIIIPKGRKKKGIKGKKFSGLQVQSFQIAQLGRDAFVKIKNTGDSLVLTEIQISPEVVIKNQFTGHTLAADEEYRLLIEAVPGTRIAKQLTMHISGLGANGKNYTQKLILQ